MADLSPAAQAVMDAANSTFDQAGTTRQGIAAALRAAANELGYGIIYNRVDVAELLAIADELEAT